MGRRRLGRVWVPVNRRNLESVVRGSARAALADLQREGSSVMTDEDLATIRARSERNRGLSWWESSALDVATLVGQDIPALLAEVERLRNRERARQVADSPQALEAAEREHDRWMAEHAALREIAQAVAAFPEAQDETHTPM